MGKRGGHAARARGHEGRYKALSGQDFPSQCGPRHPGTLGRTQDWRKTTGDSSVSVVSD